MPFIIVVVVQTHEGVTVFRTEQLVSRCVEGVDARMVKSGILAVGDKKYVCSQTAESIANPKAALVVMSIKQLANLLLCITLRLQVVEVVCLVVQVLLTHIVGMYSEYAVYYSVVNNGASIYIPMKCQPVVAYFIFGERH